MERLDAQILYQEPQIRQLRERFNPFHSMLELNPPLSKEGIGTSEPFRIPEFGSAVLQLTRLSGISGNLDQQELAQSGLTLVRFSKTETIQTPLVDSLGHLEVFVYDDEVGLSRSAKMYAAMEHRGWEVRTNPDWYAQWEMLLGLPSYQSPDITMVFENPDKLQDKLWQGDAYQATAVGNRLVIGTRLSQLKIPMFYFDLNSAVR